MTKNSKKDLPEKEDRERLTIADINKLQEYLTAVEELNRREPQKLPAEIWDKVWPEIQSTGQVPAEYRDRIGVNEVKERKHHFDGDRIVMDDGEQITKRYYDIVWERWNSEVVQLFRKYDDAILKALHAALTKDNEQQSILEMLQQLIDENKANLPAIIVRKLQQMDFPLDKPNNNIWNLFEEPTNGQIRMRFDVAKRGSGKPIDILYTLDFRGLKNVEITRKLEPYDKRVYLAIAALFNDGYEYMSLQQIYNTMAYPGRMSATDINKINAAITKMSGAWLNIDNIDESKAYKDRKHFKYDAPLLVMERAQAVVNGKIADAIIHVFREPAMVSFARERKQITTINIKLLDTPLSKTNANIALEDYLIEQIAYMKNGKIRNKMLYSTIYENAGITQKKQKQRAPAKIRKLLDHYQTCGYIKAYKEKTDGIEIQF